MTCSKAAPIAACRMVRRIRSGEEVAAATASWFLIFGFAVSGSQSEVQGPGAEAAEAVLRSLRATHLYARRARGAAILVARWSAARI